MNTIDDQETQALYDSEYANLYDVPKCSRSLTFAEFRKANVERCVSSYHEVKAWSPAEWLMCLVGEVGELASELKKLRRGDDVPMEKIRHEIGDIQAYLDLLADSLDVDLGEATKEKFNIVSLRTNSKVRL